MGSPKERQGRPNLSAQPPLVVDGLASAGCGSCGIGFGLASPVLLRKPTQGPGYSKRGECWRTDRLLNDSDSDSAGLEVELCRGTALQEWGPQNTTSSSYDGGRAGLWITAKSEV